MAIRAVEAEMAEFARVDAAVADGLALRSARHPPGRSLVYSIRLDQGEVAALERRAVSLHVKPTVLARNLIRVGLAAGGDDEFARAVDRLETAVRELRALGG
jgi:hypothetical protein